MILPDFTEAVILAVRACASFFPVACLLMADGPLSRGKFSFILLFM